MEWFDTNVRQAFLEEYRRLRESGAIDPETEENYAFAKAVLSLMAESYVIRNDPLYQRCKSF